MHGLVKANFLASPPLVVAFAIAGTTNIDLANDPLGTDAGGKPVTLADIWPGEDEIRAVMDGVLTPDIYESRYAAVEEGPPAWRELPAAGGTTFAWNEDSGYFRRPPMFQGIRREPPETGDILGGRVLVLAGDSVTTDHISPVGNIPEASPAGRYLMAQGVEPADFNNYASRRTNARRRRPGHLRQRPLPQRHGSRQDGRFHAPHARWRGDDDPRRGHALPVGRRAAGGGGWIPVRRRIVARLGGPRSQLPRGPGHPRQRVRAHPPLQPRGHGHPAASVPRRHRPLHPRHRRNGSDRT